MDDIIHTDPEFLARQEAGREALRIYHVYGDDVGGCVIKGKMTAFCFAYAAIAGWEEALHAVNELANAGRVPAQPTKPVLKIHIGGKHESVSRVGVDRQCAIGPGEIAPSA